MGQFKMKLYNGGKDDWTYSDTPWCEVYFIFLVHMLMFGVGGFLFSYHTKDFRVIDLFCLSSLFLIMIVIYIRFYLEFFGREEFKWLFINFGLGLLGAITQIEWLLSLFGLKIGDYPVYAHVIPFLFFVLYASVLRQAVLDIFDARENAVRKNRVENIYIAMSVAIYVISYFLERL
jgi:hypothetical protein